MPDDRSTTTLAWAAVLLALLAWSGSIARSGFVYDDREATFENPVVNGDLPWTEAFRRDYWHHRGDAGHYRPAATLSLRLDHTLWGERAFGYHLTNVLLHALVVMILAFTLVRMRGAGRVALLGALAFAAHPALADSVAWISGRTSMISALGGVLALLAVVRGRRTPLVQVGVTLGLLLGLLGKEDAIVFALPVLLLAWARSRRLAVACALSVVAALGVYLLLRAAALGSPLPHAPHAPLAALSFGERLLFSGRSLLEALRLTVFPVAYPPTYRFAPGFVASQAPAAWALLGWAAWFALVGGGVWAFLRGGRTRDAHGRLVGASCALAGLSLLPVLQLVPAGAVFAPRFLYLPLLFGIPALGAVLRRLPEVLLGVALALMVVGAWVRSGVYADRGAWNREVIEHVPGDVAAWNDFGLAREEEGDLVGARDAWITATRVAPGYSRSWTNLGRLALLADDLDEAERLFRRATEVGERNAVARYNLGTVLLQLARPQEAAAAFRQATQIAPGLAPAWRGLGRALLEAGDRTTARVAFSQALRLRPGDTQTRALVEALGED